MSRAPSAGQVRSDRSRRARAPECQRHCSPLARLRLETTGSWLEIVFAVISMRSSGFRVLFEAAVREAGLTYAGRVPNDYSGATAPVSNRLPLDRARQLKCQPVDVKERTPRRQFRDRSRLAMVARPGYPIAQRRCGISSRRIIRRAMSGVGLQRRLDPIGYPQKYIQPVIWPDTREFDGRTPDPQRSSRSARSDGLSVNLTG